LVEQGEQTFETYSAAAVVESGRSDDIEQLRQRRLRRLVGQAAVNETAESRNEFDTPGFDPIGSARRYLETQTKDNYRAVLADAETALLEAMSTRSVELFPTYTARWNGEAFAIGQQTIEGVAANGIQNDVSTKAEYL
jgi:uroporphyrinogen-III synthase